VGFLFLIPEKPQKELLLQLGWHKEHNDSEIGDSVLYGIFRYRAEIRR
jgi:hypothetical protein